MNNIKNIKDRCAEKADVPIIRIHDLRHSHVSLLINLGFDSFDIAKRLGHTVDMVNNIYGHWFNDAQRKMVDKLNNLRFHSTKKSNIRINLIPSVPSNVAYINKNEPNMFSSYLSAWYHTV